MAVAFGVGDAAALQVVRAELFFLSDDAGNEGGGHHAVPGAVETIAGEGIAAGANEQRPAGGVQRYRTAFLLPAGVANGNGGSPGVAQPVIPTHDVVAAALAAVGLDAGLEAIGFGERKHLNATQAAEVGDLHQSPQVGGDGSGRRGAQLAALLCELNHPGEGQAFRQSPALAVPGRLR